MEKRRYQPLAEKMRPAKLSEVIGQAHVIGSGKIISNNLKIETLKSMIFWGPPGVGKTTLARIIAKQADAEFKELSAVSSGKADIRSAVEAAQDFLRLGTRTVLFIDEIHRFNKAQQDFLLPFVEDGTVILIGATTENPSFEVIAPLMSRSSLIVLEPLAVDDVKKLLRRARKHIRGRELPAKSVDLIAQMSAGDARKALNILEFSTTIAKKIITVDVVEQASSQIGLKYDKSGEEHYNTISAFIKSMRGSDVDASLFYLHRMLESGEDPKFIARRMVIFASEDVGMASPHVLTFATSVFQAIERVGMPEANYILSHGAVALAKARKSRAVADGMYSAKQAIKDHPYARVPKHLSNAPTKLMSELGYAEGYDWQADFKHPKGFMPDGLENLRLYEED